MLRYAARASSYVFLRSRRADTGSYPLSSHQARRTSGGSQRAARSPECSPYCSHLHLESSRTPSCSLRCYVTAECSSLYAALYYTYASYPVETGAEEARLLCRCVCSLCCNHASEVECWPSSSFSFKH